MYLFHHQHDLGSIAGTANEFVQPTNSKIQLVSNYYLSAQIV